MDKRIEELFISCKIERLSRTSFNREKYEKILDLIRTKELDDDLKLKLLIELYRYSYYCDVDIGIDPRASLALKLSILGAVEEALEEDKFNNDVIEKFKEDNDKLRDYIDNPTRLIESRIRFFDKNPGAKF